MTRERLGFSVYPSRKLPVEAVVRLTRRADNLGYDSVWIPETWGIDAVTVLAVLTAHTHDIRLASGVFNIYSRSIALIAQTAATLQVVSEGRFVLGLGVSGPAVVERWHGQTFDRPLRRTRDAISGIQSLLSGARMDMQTMSPDAAGFSLAVMPTTPPPIFLAAIGPRNVRLAGEIADGWLPIFATRRGDAEAVAFFREGAQAAGRDVDSLPRAAFIPTALGANGEAELRRHLAYYIGGMGTFYAQHAARLGYGSQVDAIRAAWSEGRRREALTNVPEQLRDDVTIGGDVDEARRRLRGFRDSGVTIPVLSFPHGCSEDEIESALERLAPGSDHGDQYH